MGGTLLLPRPLLIRATRRGDGPAEIADAYEVTVEMAAVPLQHNQTGEAGAAPVRVVSSTASCPVTPPADYRGRTSWHGPPSGPRTAARWCHTSSFRSRLCLFLPAEPQLSTAAFRLRIR
jgi:hypothetical protein